MICAVNKKKLLNVIVSCNVPFIGTVFAYILSKQKVIKFLDNTTHKKVKEMLIPGNKHLLPPLLLYKYIAQYHYILIAFFME